MCNKSAKEETSVARKSLFIITPNNEVVGGYIGFTPSVRPSVRPDESAAVPWVALSNHTLCGEMPLCG